MPGFFISLCGAVKYPCSAFGYALNCIVFRMAEPECDLLHLITP
jgi:hypothetical protein